MKNIVILFMIWFVSILTLSAQDCILENSYIKVVIDDNDGTFGSGKGKDKILGIYNKKLEVDYLTLGIHFEFFSLKIDNGIYVNDNSVFQQSMRGNYEGYDLPNKRENKDKKLKTQLTCYTEKNKSKAITKVKNQLEVRHIYSLQQNNSNSAFIQINVEVENISHEMINSVKYARGIDPDPADATTINEKGRIKKDLTSKDLVFSQGETSKAPLGIYTRDKMTHNVAMICMNENHCRGNAKLLYDPDIILNDSGPNNSIEDAAIYIAFDLGSLKPNEVKKFSFKYILGDSISDIFKPPKKATGTLKKDSQVVSYKYINNYEKINASNNYIIFDIQKGKGIKKVIGKYNYKLKAKNIPEGIELHFGKKILSKSNNIISVPSFKYDKKMEFEVYRNKNFESKSEEMIVISLEGNDKITTEKKKLKIIPKPRKITFKINKVSSMSLADLADANKSKNKPLDIKIYADDEEIEDQEYKLFKPLISKESSGLDTELVYQNNRPHILLSPYTFLFMPILCLTDLESDIIVKVAPSLRYSTIYPNDNGSTKLNVVLTDISWWDKCKIVIRNILIFLFTLWYLFGLFRKDKFCKNQQLKGFRKLEDDEDMPPIGIWRLMKKVPWWQELIPYKSEWVKINNMIFIAGTNCSMVYLSRKTQEGIEIEGEMIDNPGKREEKVFSNSVMITGREEYYLT